MFTDTYLRKTLMYACIHQTQDERGSKQKKKFNVGGLKKDFLAHSAGSVACVEAEYFAAAPGTNKLFHQVHHSKHCLKASLNVWTYTPQRVYGTFLHHESDAARPHGQRGNHLTHAQQ